MSEWRSGDWRIEKRSKASRKKEKTSHWQMYIRIKWIDDGVLNAFSAVASIRNDFRQRSNSNKEKSEMPVSFVALSGFVCVCAKFRDYVYPGNRMDFEINLVLWPFNANTHIQSTMLIGFPNQYYVWPQIKKIDDKKNGRIEIEIKSRVRQKRFLNRLFFNSFFYVQWVCAQNPI